MDKLKILDCSIRDGGHLNNWRFDKDFVKRYFQAVENSGIDYIELGYRTSQGLMSDSGPWRFTTDELIKEMTSQDSKIKIAVMVDVGKISEEDFKPNTETKIDLIRVAFYKGQLDEAINLSKKFHEKGYNIGLNLMGISHYSKEELIESILKIRNSPAEVIYIADSYGSLFPEDVTELVRLMKMMSGKKVGFHPHNNLQLAFANTIKAIEAGADFVDATIEGMGRGAGNLCLETILLYLNKQGASYNVIPILSFIDKDLKIIKHDTKWGYNTPYLLSGINSCHPNYPKTLLDLGYNIEEVSEILVKFKNNSFIGFNKEALADLIKEKNGNTQR